MSVDEVEEIKQNSSYNTLLNVSMYLINGSSKQNKQQHGKVIQTNVLVSQPLEGKYFLLKYLYLKTYFFFLWLRLSTRSRLSNCFEFADAKTALKRTPPKWTHGRAFYILLQNEFISSFSPTDWGFYQRLEIQIQCLIFN